MLTRLPILFAITTLCLGIATQAAAQTKKISPLPIGTSASKGPKVAPVTMVIISDFQCYYCSKSAPIVDALVKANPHTLRVVFKHLPLAFHRQAKQAAWAAEAARRQNAFWRMHDKLYAGYKTFKQVGDMDALMVQYARDLGLDVTKFKKDYKDKAIRNIVKADMRLAASLGVRGTPTFFINGIKISGAKKQNSIQLVIDDELKKANQAIKRGVKLPDVYTYMSAKNLQRPVTIQRGKIVVPPAKAVQVPVYSHNPVKGNAKNALVTVVVFSNVQTASNTKVAQAINKLLTADKKKHVRVIFKHKVHNRYKNARMAHKGLLAAHQQRKFWALYEDLSSNLYKWSRSKDLEGYLKTRASKLGLNADQFQNDLQNPTLLGDLNEDQTLAKRLKANATTTIFVNGVKLASTQELDSTVADQIKLAKTVKKKQKLKGERLYRAMITANKQRHVAFHAKQSEQAQKALIKAIKTAPQKGTSKAKVTIVEFTALQCAYCAKSNEALRKMLTQYKGKVRIVSLHRPLPFHARGTDAALAAIAAQKQGKFWEMQALIYQNVRRLNEPEIFLELAGQLKLNTKKFQADMDSAAAKKRLQDDLNLAQALSVRGAPVYFFNGKMVTGAIREEAMKREVQQALGAK